MPQTYLNEMFQIYKSTVYFGPKSAYIWTHIIFFFLEILFIYLRKSARAGGRAEREGEAEEADSLLSREPSTGLNPRILGS